MKKPSMKMRLHQAAKTRKIQKRKTKANAKK